MFCVCLNEHQVFTSADLPISSKVVGSSIASSPDGMAAALRRLAFRQKGTLFHERGHFVKPTACYFVAMALHVLNSTEMCATSLEYILISMGHFFAHNRGKNTLHFCDFLLAAYAQSK